MQDPIERPEPETFDEFPEDEPAARTATAAEEWHETPEADAAEQRAELLELRDDPLSEAVHQSADPADAVDQARVVNFGDDDEYR